AEILGLPRVGVRDDFWSLGGHSLSATQVLSRVRRRLGADLDVRSLFEAPTIETLARRIEVRRQGAPVASAPPLLPLPRTAETQLPLSFAQQRLWFLSQLEPGALYNIPLAYRVEGRIDRTALAGALAEIVRRHDSLRTRFVKAGDEPVQEFASAEVLCGVILPLVDLAALAGGRRSRECLRLAQDEAERAFDLGREPLARFTLVRLAADEHAFLLSIHHIVSDGWSMGVLIRELGTLYAGLVAGVPARLPLLPVQYADFAVWQRGWLRGEALDRDLDYWRRRLSGAPRVLDLPTDRPRPARQSFRGGNVSGRVPPRLAARLETASRELHATPFILLMAAFQALLYRYTNQPDVLVGTPIAGRTQVEIEGLIGFFVNTLVLRTSLAGNPSFADLAGRVREAALEAYAHQELPFEQLVLALDPERSLSHAPIFQVLFVLQNNSLAFTLPGASLTPLPLHPGTAKFDLMLEVADRGRGLETVFEYSSDLFDETTAARLLEQLETLLASALAGTEARVWDLSLLSAAGRAQLLVEWNDNRAAVPYLTQHERFAAQARSTPGQVAVTFSGNELTYAEVDARSNQLAHLLRRAGAGPGVPIGVCLERSLAVPVALLAVFKAGGVLLPLDPTYPADRLAFMLTDAAAPVLLSQRKLLGRWPDGAAHLLCLEDLAEDLERQPAQASLLGGAAVAPQDLAYLTYTSGSTGRPKG
ncbi:MAG: condensation domain-containing protein, partial [Acidobacteriota bacterium]|nr:condensation domain-containing protein [Acidobacteriota bacterium]